MISTTRVWGERYGKSRPMLSDRGPRPESDVHLIDARAAPAREAQCLARALAVDAPEQSIRCLHRLAIDPEQQVADFESPGEGGRGLGDVGNNQNGGSGIEAVSCLQAERERNDSHPEVAARDVPVGRYIADRCIDRIDGDAEHLVRGAPYRHGHGTAIEIQHRAALRAMCKAQVEQETPRERAAAPRAPRPTAQLYRPPARTQILSMAPDGNDSLSKPWH